MKKALLIYNPKAGNRQILNELDLIVEKMQSYGYSMSLYRSTAKGAITQYILDQVEEDDFECILISGGDGSINECVNGMIQKKIKCPLGILPLGTANDFAYTAGIPSDIEGALTLINEQNIRYVDIGKVNEEYFINVCNMGLFSGISHIVDLELKKKFGKLAYYVKGLEELQHYQSMKLEIKIDNQILVNEYLLVLVFNGKAAGGFTKLAKNASIEDGVFDFIGIKKVELHEIPHLFLKILQGEHLNNPHIDYFTAKEITIMNVNEDKKIITDVDGEEGPNFPLSIKVESELLKVFLPNK